MAKTYFLFLFLFSGFTLTTNAQNSNLRIVAWNIEHLAEHKGAGCVARNASDYEALREFAATMNADVVALPEVENIAAIARVFPLDSWEIILSERPNSEHYICRQWPYFHSTKSSICYSKRHFL